MEHINEKDILRSKINELEEENNNLRELILMLIKSAGGEIRIPKKVMDLGVEHLIITRYFERVNREEVFKVYDGREYEVGYD